ncbi:MAG TPA: amidohydrolase family protein [Gaiellaceae bacterium]|nr:amidohydrolase family protein [Gaiellaceae bacterium]
MPGAVIDMWAPIVPVPEIMAHVAENFPDAMLGYLRVFWKQAASQEAVRAGVPAMTRSLAEVLAAIDAAGIRRTLITGFDERSTAGKTFVPNPLVAAVAERHPDRFVPFAGVDIMQGGAAVRELEHWVRERGFRGLSLRPFMIGLPADDRHYYPFYAKCVELGVPLSIHTSANWTSVAVNDLGHPRHLDPVARDFPELRIIMSHAGYPWVLEAVLLAWKYEHVYLELAAHRPRYIGEPGTGWEPLLRVGQSTIAGKVLWGSGAFLLQRPVAELVAEFRALPVKPAVMERWLHDNAATLLGE